MFEVLCNEVLGILFELIDYVFSIWINGSIWSLKDWMCYK